jgi:predicted nucleic acid-binding protein
VRIGTPDPADTKYQLYLLDTNVLRSLYWRSNEFVVSNYELVPEGCIWIPVVAFAEEMWGLSQLIKRENTSERRARSHYDMMISYHAFMTDHPVLSYTDETEVAFNAMPKTVGARDRRIAACAKTFGFKLVTRNMKDFEQLLAPQQVVDWEINPNLG